MLVDGDVYEGSFLADSELGRACDRPGLSRAKYAAARRKIT